MNYNNRHYIFMHVLTLVFDNQYTTELSQFKSLQHQSNYPTFLKDATPKLYIKSHDSSFFHSFLLSFLLRMIFLKNKFTRWLLQIPMEQSPAHLDVNLDMIQDTCPWNSTWVLPTADDITSNNFFKLLTRFEWNDESGRNLHILASILDFYVHKYPESSNQTPMGNKPIRCISFDPVLPVSHDSNMPYNNRRPILYGGWGPISLPHHHNQYEVRHCILEAAAYQARSLCLKREMNLMKR